MTQITTRERRQRKIKQAILQATRELISENGVQGISLRAIARRIDYSPAGLYEYFDSKHQLLETVRSEGLNHLRGYLEDVPSDLSPLERLFEVGLAYLEFARREPELFLLIFCRTLEGHSALEQLTRLDSPYRILHKAVQAALDAGELQAKNGVSPKQLTYGLWSLIHGLAMLQQTQFRHLECDFEAINRRTLETFARGLQAV